MVHTSPVIRVDFFLELATKDTCLAGRLPSTKKVRQILMDQFRKERELQSRSTIDSKPKSSMTRGDERDDEPMRKRQKVMALLEEISQEKEKLCQEDDQDFFKEMEDFLTCRVPETKLQNFSPLDFWKKNASIYPTLANLSRIYLSMPASSGSVERLFSIAGAIKRSQRSNLNVKTMEKLLRLRSDMISRL